MKKAIPLFLFILAAMLANIDAAEDCDPKELPAFLLGRANGAWISSRYVKIRSRASRSAGAVVNTILGDAVDVLSRGNGWAKVTHEDGKSGWVEERQLSDMWILVHKKERRLMLLEGRTVTGKWPIDLGQDPVGDKVKNGALEPGHYRTPEGELYVCRHIPESRFRKAFLLSYPSIHHAKRGLELDLITKKQYNAIVRAINNRRVPPQNTKLGNYIEIHGDGTGGQVDWTLGCIALGNEVMDEIFDKVPLGTPVVITP